MSKGSTWVLSAGLAFLLGANPAAAATKQGDRFVKDAEAAEARREFDKAAELYAKALNVDPRDSGYLLRKLKASQAAALEHVKTARDLRKAGKVQDAIAEYRTALKLDPSLSIADQEMKRVQEMAAKAEPGEAKVTPSEPRTNR